MDAPSDRDLTLAPSSSRRFTGESHAARSTAIPGTPEHGPAAHDAKASPDVSPAVSIDELPLPPLDPGMLDDHVDPLNVDVLDDFDVAGGSGILDDVFTLDPDQLFVPPGMQQPAGSGAGSLQHSEPGGSLGRSEHEKGFENEDPEKRTARLARNRESAQLSRQRKKQQLSDLERRCRSLHAANSQMHQLVARLSHENHALRHHIASTGGVPLPPHLRTPATPPPVVVLPPGATPPPGMVPLHPSMMPQATKVPLPTSGATLNKPTHTPEKPGTLRDDVPGSIPPSPEPSPDDSALATRHSTSTHAEPSVCGAGRRPIVLEPDNVFAAATEELNQSVPSFRESFRESFDASVGFPPRECTARFTAGSCDNIASVAVATLATPKNFSPADAGFEPPTSAPAPHAAARLSSALTNARTASTSATTAR